MTVKSREKSRGRPFEKGGPQGPGRGPAKGAPNAGRPKNDVVDFLGHELDDPDNQRVFQAYMKSGAPWAWALALKHTKSLPAQQHNVETVVTFKAVRE